MDKSRLTPQARKVFMDSCEYYLNSNDGSKEVFTRRVKSGSDYPRFHLIVDLGEVNYTLNLHYDVRPHVADHFRDDVPIELERINQRLQEFSFLNSGMPGVEQLRRKFVALMMFGAYEGMTRPTLSRNRDVIYGAKRSIRRKPKTGRRIDRFNSGVDNLALVDFE